MNRSQLSIIPRWEMTMNMSQIPSKTWPTAALLVAWGSTVALGNPKGPGIPRQSGVTWRDDTATTYQAWEWALSFLTLLSWYIFQICCTTFFIYCDWYYWWKNIYILWNIVPFWDRYCFWILHRFLDLRLSPLEKPFEDPVLVPGRTLSTEEPWRIPPVTRHDSSEGSPMWTVEEPFWKFFFLRVYLPNSSYGVTALTNRGHYSNMG